MSSCPQSTASSTLTAVMPFSDVCQHVHSNFFTSSKMQHLILASTSQQKKPHVTSPVSSLDWLPLVDHINYKSSILACKLATRPAPSTQPELPNSGLCYFSPLMNDLMKRSWWGQSPRMEKCYYLPFLASPLVLINQKHAKEICNDKQCF